MDVKQKPEDTFLDYIKLLELMLEEMKKSGVSSRDPHIYTVSATLRLAREIYVKLNEVIQRIETLENEK